jgi:hypothetical protein
MRASIVAIIVGMVFAGCERHSEPATNGVVRESSIADLHAVPPGRYDAMFTCYEGGWNDTKDFAKEARTDVYFYNDTGRMIHFPLSITVSLNGDILKDGKNGHVHVSFPGQMTWRITGDDHYPSLIHTISSNPPIEFLSPDDLDSMHLSDSIVVKYNAPGADTVQIHMSYFGQSILKRDSTKKESTENYGQSYYFRVPNTGRYVIAPFKMSHYFSSFDPKNLFMEIKWARGDTVHVGSCLYGFVTQYNCQHWFKLKH